MPDNAPIHRSQEFEEQLERWEKAGLKFYFLPAYCPSLNKIEMLWQKIKYDWLSWKAYGSDEIYAKNSTTFFPKSAQNT